MNIKTSGEYGIGGGGRAETRLAKPMNASDRLDNAMDEVERAAAELDSRLGTIFSRLTGGNIPSGDSGPEGDHEGSIFGRAMGQTGHTMQNLDRALATVAKLEEEIGL